MFIVLASDLDETIESAVSEKRAIQDKPIDLESKSTSSYMATRSGTVSPTEKVAELVTPQTSPKLGANPPSKLPSTEDEEEFDWVEVLYDELLIVGTLGMTVTGRHGNRCYFFPNPTGFLSVKLIDFHGKASTHV